MSCRPGVEEDGAALICQRVSAAEVRRAPGRRSSRAGVALASAASCRRRVAVRSALLTSPSTAAATPERKPSSIVHNTCSGLSASISSRREGST